MVPPAAELFAAVRRYAAVAAPGCLPLTVEIVLAPGGRIVLNVPAAVELAAPPDAPTPATPRAPARHSPDFRSVHWFGVSYSFTALQGAMVRILWEAWEDGTPDVGQERLLEEAGSEANRIRDLFRGHPAWGALIGPGESRGAFRLLEP